MLELTADYVTERRQFGVPVGSFQAVKHQLADALLALEFAAPAVLAAAGLLAARAARRGRRDVRWRWCSPPRRRRGARALAIQCHGAIGYTVEYDLQLYAKRSWALPPAARPSMRDRYPDGWPASAAPPWREHHDRRDAKPSFATASTARSRSSR